MHGEISLTSALGVGTKATFWIPFNKAPYNAGDISLVDMGPIPIRLQSDLSVSEYSDPATPRSTGIFGQARTPSESLHPSSSLVDRVHDLSAEERRKTHVLVVEGEPGRPVCKSNVAYMIPDNPINQQIAIKTIKKLHFSVSAVWNGQEALEYLMQPESPSHPRPDVILMDVQMPVMDGYRATHTIRHDAPFVSDRQIQNTPIVAMTASAIQGDREKCESAGMNDYLAKPVKGKILEQMLVKWANARRMGSIHPEHGPTANSERASSRIESGQNEVPGSFQITALSRPSQPTTSTFVDDLNAEDPSANPDKLASKLTQLDYVSKSALARSIETPESRAMRHLHNEEKAMQLRDEQLIASGNDPKDHFTRGASDDDDVVGNAGVGDQRLTCENVKKLADDEKDEIGGRAKLDAKSSSMVVALDDTSLLAGSRETALRGGWNQARE